MASLVQFLFIFMLPIIIVIATLVGLFAVGALFDALDNMDELKQRVEAAFRGTPPQSKPVSASHYYQPYWR
jgi:hypothetical protein